MADKSLLIGDEAADVLMQYAALIAQIHRGDAVVLRALGVDGAQVEVTFLLNGGTVLLAESSTSVLPEPDNTDAVTYMREQLASYGPDGGAHSPASGAVADAEQA